MADARQICIVGAIYPKTASEYVRWSRCEVSLYMGPEKSTVLVLRSEERPDRVFGSSVVGVNRWVVDGARREVVVRVQCSASDVSVYSSRTSVVERRVTALLLLPRRHGKAVDNMPAGLLVGQAWNRADLLRYSQTLPSLPRASHAWAPLDRFV